MKPQQFAQYVKAGRGFLITRNSATLADTDYEHIAREICSALNDRARLVAALRDCAMALNESEKLVADTVARALLAEIKGAQ